jgi:hypothetical protein
VPFTALASRMRTKWEVELPAAFRRSVRVDILAALRYNFPAEPVLFESNTENDRGYEAVERFCRNSEVHLGQTWAPAPSHGFRQLWAGQFKWL